MMSVVRAYEGDVLNVLNVCLNGSPYKSVVPRTSGRTNFCTYVLALLCITEVISGEDVCYSVVCDALVGVLCLVLRGLVCL